MKWEEAKEALNNDRYSTDDFKTNVDYITVEADLLDGLIQAAEEEIAKWKNTALDGNSRLKAKEKDMANVGKEIARLREALLEIVEHSGRTGEDSYVMAEIALDTLKGNGDDV